MADNKQDKTPKVPKSERHLNSSRTEENERGDCTDSRAVELSDMEAALKGIQEETQQSFEHVNSEGASAIVASSPADNQSAKDGFASPTGSAVKKNGTPSPRNNVRNNRSHPYASPPGSNNPSPRRLNSTVRSFKQNVLSYPVL